MSGKIYICKDDIAPGDSLIAVRNTKKYGSQESIDVLGKLRDNHIIKCFYMIDDKGVIGLAEFFADRGLLAKIDDLFPSSGSLQRLVNQWKKRYPEREIKEIFFNRFGNHYFMVPCEKRESDKLNKKKEPDILDRIEDYGFFDTKKAGLIEKAEGNRKGILFTNICETEGFPLYLKGE